MKPGDLVEVKLPFDPKPFKARISHEPCLLPDCYRVERVKPSRKHPWPVNVFKEYCTPAK